MDTLTSKLTGQTVDVLEARTTVVNGNETLLVWVYNSDTGKWETRFADDYYPTNQDVNAYYKEVSTLQELEDALVNPVVKTIAVTTPIVVTDDVINLSGVSNKTITGLDLTVTISSQEPESIKPLAEDLKKALTLSNCNNVTLIDSSITLSIDDVEVWKGAYVVHLYECRNIKFAGTTTLTGGNTGILCNDTVELTCEDNFRIVDATFGGIELTKGSSADRFPGPDIVLQADIKEFSYNIQSKYDRPIIYSDLVKSFGFHNNSHVNLEYYYDYAKQQAKFFSI